MRRERRGREGEEGEEEGEGMPGNGVDGGVGIGRDGRGKKDVDGGRGKVEAERGWGVKR